MSLVTASRKALVRVINRGGRWLGNGRSRVTDLDLQRLLDEAMQRTGLTDFGSDEFLGPLVLLLDSLAHEAELNLLGRIAMREDILQKLDMRLRIEADRKRNPDIADAGVEAPIFITGLPRSGTTLLHNLLAQDPGLRVPLGWEVMFPSPAVADQSFGTDSRIGMAQKRMERLYWLAPEFKVIHPLDASQPQECIAITSYTFTSDAFPVMCHIPGYLQWLDTTDLTPSYRYHRRFLQQLQAGRRHVRWVLKAPAHLFALDSLLQVYPDARIVQMHRDPLQALPSVANLTLVLRSAFSDSQDPAVIGHEVRARWLTGVQRAQQVLSQLPDREERCCDIVYPQFSARPLESIERLYRHFGLDLTAATRRRMQQCLQQLPKDRFGKHRYSLDQFDMDPDQTSRMFEEYRQTWGVAD